MGCGEGIIQEKIGTFNYNKYLGIDISDEAIKKGMNKKNEKTFFQLVDIFNFNTNETFDVIIFNEILYYIDKNKILGLMKQYEKFLAFVTRL